MRLTPSHLDTLRAHAADAVGIDRPPLYPAPSRPGSAPEAPPARQRAHSALRAIMYASTVAVALAGFLLTHENAHAATRATCAPSISGTTCNVAGVPYSTGIYVLYEGSYPDVSSVISKPGTYSPWAAGSSPITGLTTNGATIDLPATSGTFAGQGFAGTFTTFWVRYEPTQPSGMTPSTATLTASTTYLNFEDGQPDTGLFGQTGIIKFNAPELYSVHSSPVSVEFEYQYASCATCSPAPTYFDQYRLIFTNTTSGATKTVFGSIDNVATGIFTQSTTTTLVGDGTWKVEGALVSPPDTTFGTRIYAPRGAFTFFGLNYNDDPSAVAPYLPPSQADFDGSSCEINFLGTFDFTECLGFIIVPTKGTTSPMVQIQRITLAQTFPFAYAYQLNDMRQALFTASSTASTSLAISIPWLNNSTTTITFISQSMVAAIPFAPLIKSLLIALLWFMFAEFCYYRIIRVHDTHTPS